jgi:hypothetical protein
MLAVMPWVNGLAVVGDGNVGIQKNRAVDFPHYLAVLLEHQVLLYLFSLLHEFGGYLQPCQFLLPKFLLKVFIFADSQFLQIDLDFLDLDFLSL